MNVRTLRATAAAAAVVAMTLAGIPGAAAAAPRARTAARADTCRNWGAEPAAVGSGDNRLNDVSFAKRCVAIAVGHSTDVAADIALAERWNGRRWRVMETPNVGASSDLSGVDALSPRQAWAVGRVESGADDSFILRWDGDAWTQETSPNPGTTNNELQDVVALSARDVWAVGRTASGAPFRTFIVHWNGHRWRQVTSPNAGTGNNELTAIAAVSPDDLWAVGHAYDPDLNAYRTLILHWNGRRWSIVRSPNAGPDDNDLNGVSAGAGDDVWAVGRAFGSTSFRTLTLHFAGRRWKEVASPNIGSNTNELHDVVTLGRNTRAVGRYDDQTSGNFLSLLLRWTGSRWKRQRHPHIGTTDELYGIDATPAGGWAVGNDDTGPTLPLAIAAHLTAVA